jgi:hypothetical protein
MREFTQNRQIGNALPLAVMNRIRRQIGGIWSPYRKSASDQGLCGGDMSPPNGTYETRNIKSGSEKGIDAGQVGDISAGAAETPL